jgi:ABC-type lipoprotein export system ATPase subunit
VARESSGDVLGCGAAALAGPTATAAVTATVTTSGSFFERGIDRYESGLRQSSHAPFESTSDRGTLDEMEPVVARMRGVVKNYSSGAARRRVLDGVDLDVGGGELVAVVGRSGSGKSTLLHLLGGLDRSDSGSIEVGGLRVDREDEAGLTDLRRSKVGFVFQAFHLLPELTGMENVLLPARLSGDGRVAAARARELISRLDLEEPASRLPTSLSGGEQQRLAIVRALVNDPVLLLADEPTGNLDTDSAMSVLQLLREIANGGRGVVLVTHDAEAAEVADRVLTLRDGRLQT